MPWDGTELWLARPRRGRRGSRRRAPVAGGGADWIAQPRWSPDGVLYFVAEPSGWMNLYRLADGAGPSRPADGGRVRPARLESSARRTTPSSRRGEVLAVGADRRARPALVGSSRDRRRDRVDLPFTEIDFVAVTRRAGLFVRADRDRTPAAWSSWTWRPATLSPASAAARCADRPAASSRCRGPSTSRRPAGATAYGLFYPPRNRRVRRPAGELPPLIVTSHGGPTAERPRGARASAIQFFTSRGYRRASTSTTAAAPATAAPTARRSRASGASSTWTTASPARATWPREGLVDGDRLAIRGGSASGYTTLCALTFRDDFRAGVSYFGIGDLETFARDTHKFESRYLDRLVGP